MNGMPIFILPELYTFVEDVEDVLTEYKRQANGMNSVAKHSATQQLVIQLLRRANILHLFRAQPIRSIAHWPVINVVNGHRCQKL